MTERASLRAVRVSKWYGRVTALQDVTVELGPGVWGLLGPNGSGKTTFLRLAAGQLRPSLGRITIGGERPFANPRALGRIGFCPEAEGLYDELTALELVTALAECSGYARAIARDRASRTLDTLGLGDAMDRPVGTYSRGMRQRTKLAQALVHDPEVLLLDEPLSGTDPVSRHVILREVAARAEAGALVLFSTHVLHEVEALTDRVLLIARGQLVAQGAVHEIRDLLDEHPHHIRVTCREPRALAAASIGAPGVVAVRFPAPDAVELETQAPEETYRALARALLEHDVGFTTLTSPDATLEALFHYLVERGSRMAGTGVDAAVGRVQAAGSDAAAPGTRTGAP